MFREPEGTKVFETDTLAVALTNVDEVKKDIQKVSGAKDTSGTFYSANPTISVAAPKPLSSSMDSRSVVQTKIPSFASSNVYPPMPLKPPAPVGGGIKSKALNSSLSGEGYSLKVGSFSFGSPVSTSAVSKPIFYIKATEDKTKIPAPMLSESGKNFVSFGSLDPSASPKSTGGGFAAYFSTSGSGGFKFGSSKGRSEFETSSKIKTEHSSGE